MKVCFLTELYPPSIGGQEQRFSALADWLSLRGHQVTVLCIRHAKVAAAEERLASGVTVIRRPLLPHYYKPAGGRIPRSPLGMLRYAWAVRRLLRRHAFDALFLNQWPLLHVLALPRCWRMRAVLDWCEIRSSAIFRVLQWALPKLVAANTAVATQVAQHVRERTSAPVLLLPSGIEPRCYHQADAAHRRGVLYLGRIAHHKNLPLLIEAYEELCRRGYTGALTIAGDGPAFETLQARVRASPFASRIALPRFVSEEEKRAMLADAHILALTSQREGFPRVIAEAMASGLPVVTARYPQNGAAAVVEEYRCGLCADATPHGIADAAETVLRSWETWSAQAQAAAPRMDWASLGEDFETLLRETVQAATSTLTKEHHAHRRDGWRRVYRQASFGLARPQRARGVDH